MGYQQSPAFHIHRFDYSETSQIATFFTRDHGKVTAIAKGARREKNDYDGPIDLLVRSRITWIQRPPDRLSILTGCDQQDPLRTLRRNRHRLVYGFWVIFVLNRLTATGQRNRSLFDHVRSFVDHLKTTYHVRRSCLFFDLFTLKHLGHLPRLNQCVFCERPVSEADRIQFSFHAGGVVCQGCRRRAQSSKNQKGRDRLPVNTTSLLSPSAGTLRALTAVLAGDDPFEAAPVEFSDSQLSESRRLLNHCYRYLLGYDTELLSML
jgi:DNA repair protein RecO (recombination protein O)